MWLSVVLARIGVLCGLGLALFITRDLLAPAPQLPCDFILLGSVSSNGATILVKGCEEGVETAVLKLFRDKSSPSPALIAEAQPDIRIANDDGKMWFGSCEFLRLEANTTYRVEYHRKQISFKTFPTSSSEPLRISFGSCSSLTSFPWNSLSSAFTKILDLHPTLALFLGDNVYTDVHETLPWYRIPFDTAYLRLLADPAVVKLRQTVPTYTMFDDHEVENDFQGLQHPLATKGLEAYVKFMGQTNPGRSLNISKLYYSFDYATTASFFVVDTRLNYNPEKGLLLGTAQKDELLSWLRRGAKLGFDHLIIASPLSWSADGHGDTFDRDRKEVFDEIRGLNLCNVIILSGDMHFGAAYKHAHGRILEFSASPFQAFPFWPDPNHRDDASTGYERIFIHGGLNFFFGMLSLNASTGSFELYTWPLFHPQYEPRLLETFTFSANRCL